MVHEIGRRGLLAGGLAVALAAAGCRSSAPPAGDATGTAEIQGPSEADAVRALTAWAAFPVTASPRPLVLIDAPVLDPAGGLPDTGSKLAYLAGAFDLPASYPTGPARAAGLPLIGAKQAAAALVAHGTATPVSPARLRVTGVRLGSAGFRTDRGSMPLPAWLFSLAGVRQPAAVLAVAPSARFTPRLPATGAGHDLSLGNATLSADGRTVSVGFLSPNAGTAACKQRYALRVVESLQAVALRIGLVDAPDEAGEKDDRPGVCRDASYHRSASAKLSLPLGARVLISARDGSPFPVAAGT